MVIVMLVQHWATSALGRRRGSRGTGVCKGDGSLPGCSAWAGEVQEVPLTLPDSLSINVRDLMGNPIDIRKPLSVDSAPVYLIVERKNETRLLDALDARLLARHDTP